MLKARVKKSELEGTREDAIVSAVARATGAFKVSLCMDDRGDLGYVAVCEFRNVAGKTTQKEYLLGKAARFFLDKKPNTLKPFRFTLRPGAWA